MKVGDSVRRAIADWEQGEAEGAMLHPNPLTPNPPSRRKS
jgi:hypothetical protein